tara:strand:- start:43 stop:825 length:783 start_codon:yes stop_codon:yes gene_type:complete
MIHNSKELLKSLKHLKEKYNVVGIKSSFEDEGVIFNELIKLKELCVLSGLDLNIKIGGCEAISDIKNCLLLNVNGVIAPMIESPFSLEKFVTSVHDNVPSSIKDTMGFYTNIESKTAYSNITNILESSSCKHLKGIVVGRSDLTKSFGLTKNNVNDDEIYSIVLDILTEAKKYKLTTTMGGNISVKSSDFIKKLYSKKLLDKIESRNVMFKLNDNNINNLEKAIQSGLEFEALWLRTKASYYMGIGNSYLNRASILDGRS